MSLEVPEFSHDYQPGAIHYGRGCVSTIGDRLAEHGIERALVVCGRNVGANRALMDPITVGLQSIKVELFDETTPAKRIETVYDGVERLREFDADAVVAVGAGSSMDVARFIRLLDGEYRPLEELITETEGEGTLTAPDDPAGLVPLFTVPTTFAGADLSVGAAATYPASDGERAETILVSDGLMPTGLFYDPDLYDTTPTEVLVGSAFNGFDKALEMAYSAFANPITDAAAVRGLAYLQDSLPDLRGDDPAVMERAVLGVLLAQYGVSMPKKYKCNVIHAFGHGLRNEFGVQQGIAHAVMAPHVLELIFEQTDGRRDLLADGLGVDTDGDPAPAIVEAVTEIREGLGLPARLRDLDGPSRDGLRRAAELTHEDTFMAVGPEGFEPTIDDVEVILEQAW